MDSFTRTLKDSKKHRLGLDKQAEIEYNKTESLETLATLRIVTRMEHLSVRKVEFRYIDDEGPESGSEKSDTYL